MPLWDHAVPDQTSSRSSWANSALSEMTANRASGPGGPSAARLSRRPSRSSEIDVSSIPVIARSVSDEAIHVARERKMDCFRLRSSSYGGQVASLAMTLGAALLSHVQQVLAGEL